MFPIAKESQNKEIEEVGCLVICEAIDQSKKTKHGVLTTLVDYPIQKINIEKNGFYMGSETEDISSELQENKRYLFRKSLLP